MLPISLRVMNRPYSAEPDIFFSLVFSFLPKDFTIQNLLIFTATGVVPCDGRKCLPVHRHGAGYIFWSFVINEFLDRSLKREFWSSQC